MVSAESTPTEKFRGSGAPASGQDTVGSSEREKREGGIRALAGEAGTGTGYLHVRWKMHSPDLFRTTKFSIMPDAPAEILLLS